MLAHGGMVKTTKDTRFGIVHHPATIEELFLLAVGSPAQRAPVYMWRGQANSDWLLHSSAYRRLQISEKPNERSVAAYEQRLLRKATHRGYRIGEGQPLSDFELLAKLQHHGAATRLIDCTRNFLVALFFACQSLSDCNGLIFGIHSHGLGGGEGVPLDDTYSAAITRIAKYNHPQTWEPPNVSRRVAAQHSQFIYSEIALGKPHGSLALDINKYLLSIFIPSSDKGHYLSVLNEVFDISSSTLFPDLDGFGLVNGPSKGQWSADRW